MHVQCTGKQVLWQTVRTYSELNIILIISVFALSPIELGNQTQLQHLFLLSDNSYPDLEVFASVETFTSEKLNVS